MITMRFKFAFVLLTMLSAFATAARVNVEDFDTLPPQWSGIVTQKDITGINKGYVEYFDNVSDLVGSSSSYNYKRVTEYIDSKGDFIGVFQRGKVMQDGRTSDDIFFHSDKSGDTIISNGITLLRTLVPDVGDLNRTIYVEDSVQLDSVNKTTLHPYEWNTVTFEKIIIYGGRGFTPSSTRTYYFDASRNAIGFADVRKRQFKVQYEFYARDHVSPIGYVGPIGFGRLQGGKMTWYDQHWNPLLISRTERDYGNIRITERAYNNGTKIDVSYSIGELPWIMTISSPSGSLGSNQETLEFQKKVFNHLAEGCDGNGVRHFTETVSFETGQHDMYSDGESQRRRLHDSVDVSDGYADSYVGH